MLRVFLWKCDFSDFWTRLMEQIKHLSFNLVQKKVNGLQPKIISAKKSTLDV